jgi:hypothetical protein
VSQLHNDCSTPHVGAVKTEFGGLDVAIVPNGTPNRGAQGDHMFVLWTPIFARQIEENRFCLYAFLMDGNSF